MNVFETRSAWVCASIALMSFACSSSSTNNSELFQSDAGGSGGGPGSVGGATTGGVGGVSGGSGGGAGASGSASGGMGGASGSASGGASGSPSGGASGASGASGSAGGGAGGNGGAAGAAAGGVGGDSGSGGGGGTGGGCVPLTCAGACNTSFPDGCGGTVTCGGCGSNAFACIGNSCQLVATSACGSCPGGLSVLAQLPGSDDCSCAAGGVMCGDPAYVVSHGFGVTCGGTSKFATSVYDCSVSQTYTVCVK